MLFTIAFLLLVPPNWENAQAGYDKGALASMAPGLADYAVLLGQCGFASLALILVVLILVWKGYVKRLRWTWFVMFIIVCGWYFPLFVLPSLRYLQGFNLIRWLSSLAHLGSWSYNPPAWVVIFLLMLVALILPIRSFFGAVEKED